MGTGIPPIGVTFTGNTDGVAVAVRELTSQIRSLSSVQKQNARASEDMAAAGKKAAGQISQANAALGALGATIGVAKLTRLLTDALDTGDAIFKLSQKTGASTEALSVLAFAGRTADVSLDDLGTTLKFLSKAIGDLQRGEPAAVAAFHAIGLEAKDLKGLSLDQVLLKIADAQARFADGSGKAEAMLRIFGRSGSDIIPLLNDLANGGFDRAAEAAQRLGLVFTRDQAKAAQDFNDSMAVMKASAAGLAGELTKGAIPTLTQLANGTAEAIANLPGPIRETIANLVAMEGAVVGVASAIRLLQIAGIGAALTNPFSLAALGIGAIASVLLTMAGNAARAKAEYASFLETLKDTKSIDAERQRLELELAANEAAYDATNSTFRHLALLKERQRIQEQIAQLDARRQTVATPDRPGAVVPDPAVLAARRAAQQSAIQQELQLEQERIRGYAQANQEQFDQGIQGIKTYYDRRRGLIEEGIASEIRALEAERQVIVKTPATDAAAAIKQQQDIAKIDNQIAQKRTSVATQISESDEQQRLAERALAEERLSFESRIQQAKGQTLQATLAGIDQEARKFDELLAKQGVPSAERGTRVDQFRNALGLRAQVDDVSQRAQLAFADIDAARERIAQQVSVGQLTELQGQQQLAAIEADRLPGIQALAAQMQQFAAALGDPALIEAAQQLAVQVNGIAAAADLASQRSAKLRSGILDAGNGAITDLLSSGADQIGQPNPNNGAIEERQRQAEEVQKQIEEANAAAADGDEAAAARVRLLTAEYERLQDRIAELKDETFWLDDAMRQFFTDVLEGIRKALNEMIAAQIIGGIGKLFGGGGGTIDVGTLAEGGPVGGVGSPTSDSNLILASRTEFMQPGRAVRHYGLGFMEDVRHLRFPKFAGGGLIGDASLAGVQTSVIAPTVRTPSIPRAPEIPEDAALRRFALDGELRVGLERGLVLDMIRSYMGSSEAERDHVRLAAATKNRRRVGGL